LSFSQYFCLSAVGAAAEEEEEVGAEAAAAVSAAAVSLEAEEPQGAGDGIMTKGDNDERR
nr:hypothetical protein [Planctomycetota bacterium]